MKTAIDKIKYEPSPVITKENLHTFSKKTQDLYAFFEKNKNTIFAPKKYLPSQKIMILKKVNNIYTKDSETPLIKVIIQILGDLPDFLPGDNLLLVTGYIVKEWSRLQEGKIEKVA